MVDEVKYLVETSAIKGNLKETETLVSTPNAELRVTSIVLDILTTFVVLQRNLPTFQISGSFVFYVLACMITYGNR